MTGDDLIGQSLRLIGKLGEGEPATGQAAEDARLMLNDLLDQWQANSLLVETLKEDTFNLTADTATYTIGSGGTWNITRPTHIVRASVTPDSGATDVLDIPIAVFTAQQWAAVRVKSTTASFPYGIFYDKLMDANSRGTVHVYPVPTNTSAQIVLWTPEILNVFANLTTDYTFGPGYALALRLNLALLLAPEYGVLQVAPGLERRAAMALQVLERLNANDDVMLVDVGLLEHRRGGYNALTDEG